jgi:hypothetical protein
MSRLHSTNSLVSSSDDEGNADIRENPHPRPRTDSNGSLSTTDGDTTSVDSSACDKLRHVTMRAMQAFGKKPHPRPRTDALQRKSVNNGR